MIEAPAPGFTDPVHDSQAVFRLMLESLSRPGKIIPMKVAVPAPTGVLPETAAIALTLFDTDTAVWLQDGSPALLDYLGFHCGCPVSATPGDATFAVITDIGSCPAISAFNPGTPEYPDRSSTLIIQVGSLAGRIARRITGPGIREAEHIAIAELPSTFWRSVESNHALYPCGVDMIFVAPGAILGLPRSTRLEN